jgi:DNA-binding PadR family transcriptional regulator
VKIRDYFRLADPPEPLQPAVYLIRRERDGLFKIGQSTRHDRRTREIVRQCPEGAEVVHIIRTEALREAEAAFHRVFKVWRVEGEWFELTEEHVEWIKSFTTWPRETRPARHAARGEAEER